MSRNVKILPGSPEHMRLISPSKIASILGISRWQSAYGLWQVMSGRVQQDPPKDIFKAGHAMELAMAELWKLDHPDWRLSPGEVQYVTDEYGFPAVCTIDRKASKGRSKHIVEMKIARDLNEWGDDFSGDCPQDYAAQVLSQMLFTGMHDQAHLLVLSGWYKHFTYTIDWDDRVADFIVEKCKAFYDSLGGEPPDLDNSEATYRTVKKMHPDITQGAVVELPYDLIEGYTEARREANDWETTLRGYKTKILDLMGNAQTGSINGERVATRTPGAKGSVTLRVR